MQDASAQTEDGGIPAQGRFTVTPETSQRPARLIVKDIPLGTTLEQLRTIFQVFVEVLDLRFAAGKQEGVITAALVTMGSADAATRATVRLNGLHFGQSKKDRFLRAVRRTLQGDRFQLALGLANEQVFLSQCF